MKTLCQVKINCHLLLVESRYLYMSPKRASIYCYLLIADLIDALGPENKDIFDPVEEDADTQFFCPNEGCGRNSSSSALNFVKDHEIALRPHPYSGVNIGVDGRGGPVLRCPKCSVIFHAAPIDMWSLRTNKPHAGYVQRRNVFDNRRRVLIERLIKLLVSTATTKMMLC